MKIKLESRLQHIDIRLPPYNGVVFSNVSSKKINKFLRWLKLKINNNSNYFGNVVFENIFNNKKG